MAYKRTINPGGTRGTKYREVARERLKDAEVLLQKQRYVAAVYLAGYAVECLLKWAITERRQLGSYLPAKFESHELDRLLNEAGLRPELDRDEKLKAAYSELAGVWSPELRYQAKTIEAKKAERLYGESEQVYEWLRETV